MELVVDHKGRIRGVVCTTVAHPIPHLSSLSSLVRVFGIKSNGDPPLSPLTSVQPGVIINQQHPQLVTKQQLPFFIHHLGGIILQNSTTTAHQPIILTVPPPLSPFAFWSRTSTRHHHPGTTTLGFLLEAWAKRILANTALGDQEERSG